jgi:hypothetical protein
MFHGAGLIYRLLDGYPPDRLLALETRFTRAAPELRLPGVTYQVFAIPGNRLRFTRVSHWAGSWFLLATPRHARRLRLEAFAPEGVLTVTLGYSWLVAARFAETEKLPLHLILHDDWPPSMPVVRWLRTRQDQSFGRAYRYASSRLCVSPFMEEEYRKMYGVPGQVLYPSWAKEFSPIGGIPWAYGNHAGPLVGAYAGNIFRKGYTQLIAGIAELLAARGGRLLLFGPNTPEQLKSAGLDRNCIVPQGVVSPQEMISRVRAEADFVFVPMSFESDSMRRNMRISFPSKLTDYAAAGLPLLIWGPSYCSAVRWAQRHAPFALVVTDPRMAEIDVALDRLEQGHYRERVGRAVREIGERLFSHGAAMKVFHGALTCGRSVEQSAERSPLGIG